MSETPALPRAGGVVRYPVYSHGPLLGYLMGFITLIAFSSLVAIEVVAARQYAAAWFPSLTQSGTSNPTLLGWLKLALWLWKPKNADMRVPLMGVLKRLQSSRMASQLAFMMIEAIRLEAVGKFESTRGELGWVLEDNQGMLAIADTIKSKVNREYVIYERKLG